MANVSETITIPAAVDDVWPLLRDPALVASCIPGATLAPEQDGETWKGSIRVKFGPTVAVFRGEATLAYDDAMKRCTIEGRGIDQRGASRALAHGVVTAAADGAATKLIVDGEYSVTGPLETFANAGGVHVARALLAEFSTNMAKVVAERGGAATTDAAATSAIAPSAGAARADTPAVTAPTHQPRPAAAELSAGKLLWAAFLSWLKSIFRMGSPKP